jgi:hypothetical protein
VPGNRQHSFLAAAGAENRGAARRCTLRAVGLGLALFGASLWHAPASAEEESTADALFREGRHLLANGQAAEACDKFAESQRLEPSSGALLNLARCHADAGMTATAWAEYLEAARLARGRERHQQAAEAELRAAELQPRLTRLRVELEPQSPGVVVTRNGEPLGPSDLNVPLIVDPGSHVIRAAGPGRSEWTVTVLAAQPGQVRTVRIPALTALPTAPVPARQPSQSERPAAAATQAESHTVSVRTWVTAGVGAAALVTSGVLAVVAKSKWDGAHEDGSCDAAHACNGLGIRETDQARRLGYMATGFAVLGVAAGGCAALFYWLDVSSKKAPVQARVAVGPGSVTFQGGF